jgi:hypothetical protein
MENIEQKAQDDQDFLHSYGSLRTSIPSQAYKDGWDRIFRSTDRDVTPVDVNSGESN